MPQNSQSVQRPSTSVTRKRGLSGRTADPRPSKKTPPDSPSDGAGASSGSTSEATSKTTKAQKGKPCEAYRLRKTVWPKGAEGVMDAFNLYLRILMNYLEPNSPPPLPDPVDVKTFNARFTDPSDVFRDRYTKPSPKQLALLGTIARFRDIPSDSKIAAHAAQLEEHAIHTAITAQCQFGLSAFRPDLFAPPFSAYNSAHRIFAIDTFNQLACSHVFFFLKPKLSLVRDPVFMTEAYNHYVHYEWKNLAKLERKQPRAVAERHAKNNVYQRRIRTSTARAKYLEEQERAPDRYIALVSDPAANSDDERRPGPREEYEVKDKARRGPRCAMFMDAIDGRRLEFMRSKRGSRMTERTRIRPKVPQPSPLLALPEPGIPLDFFGPVIFNSLPYAIRRRYSQNARVALPRHDKDIWSRKYMKMSDDEFMETEGKEILKDYHLVYDSDSEDEDDQMDVDDDPTSSALEAHCFSQLMRIGPSGSASTSTA